MARENQGLQIALIIFVTFTVGFSGATYWTYRLYDEQYNKTKSALDDVKKNGDLAAKNGKEIEDLKGLIGVPKTEDINAVFKDFDEDMKSYGGSYPEESRFYRPLLEKMAKTIKEKSNDLADVRAKLPLIEAAYKSREDAKESQVKEFQDAATKASQDLTGEQNKFKGERSRLNQEKSDLESEKLAAIKAKTELGTNLESMKQKYEQRIKKILDTYDETTKKLEKLTSGRMDAPNGEITWVNQRNGTVWINLGRIDALARQVTFGVYAANSTDVKESKAGIEVTQILGDHLAEARILTDNPGDPIIPGDKIFTPLWVSGTKRHFALAGLMDVDGAGRNNLDMMMNIIKTGGGVVDCWIADSGKSKNKVQGEITLNTNCLILGAAPDEKGDSAQRDAFTKILREAERYRIQKIQLSDFLQRIGWKNMSPVVRYGRGANPKDFRAKPEGGVVGKSTGNTSDVFKDREPPAATPSPGGAGRYQRF